MRRTLTTTPQITETGAFARAAILREAWKVYHRWFWRHDPASFAANFARVPREIWIDACEQRAAHVRLDASLTAFRVTLARRHADVETPAGRALVAELSSLVYLDDWRHAEFRPAKITVVRGDRCKSLTL